MTPAGRYELQQQFLDTKAVAALLETTPAYIVSALYRGRRIVPQPYGRVSGRHYWMADSVDIWLYYHGPPQGPGQLRLAGAEKRGKGGEKLRLAKSGREKLRPTLRTSADVRHTVALESAGVQRFWPVGRVGRVCLRAWGYSARLTAGVKS